MMKKRKFRVRGKREERQEGNWKRGESIVMVGFDTGYLKEGSISL
ncbi:MAG: hypothetical protein NT166_22190 [Candidatus Aminicenantes bacterium]|nr:hypothetical protein [Candidatus Aminicenantes bacterium]